MEGKEFLFVRWRKKQGVKEALRIIVSLKVSKKAVARNKVKRRAREIIRNLRLKPGYDITIFTNKNILSQSFAAIKSKLLFSLKGLLL